MNRVSPVEEILPAEKNERSIIKIIKIVQNERIVYSDHNYMWNDRTRKEKK